MTGYLVVEFRTIMLKLFIWIVSVHICISVTHVASSANTNSGAASAASDYGDYAKGKKHLESVLDLIYNRYELYSSAGDFFYATQNMNANSFDIYKYRWAKKLTGSTAMDRRYLMIFGGSSVTAGMRIRAVHRYL